MNNFFEQLRDRVANHPIQASYERGAIDYAFDLIFKLEKKVALGKFDLKDMNNVGALREAMLDGSPTWEDYSNTGKALTSNDAIAERLGYPPRVYDWFAAQANSLKFASGYIIWSVKDLMESEMAA